MVLRTKARRQTGKDRVNQSLYGQCQPKHNSILKPRNGMNEIAGCGENVPWQFTGLNADSEYQPAKERKREKNRTAMNREQRKVYTYGHKHESTR